MLVAMCSYSVEITFMLWMVPNSWGMPHPYIKLLAIEELHEPVSSLLLRVGHILLGKGLVKHSVCCKLQLVQHSFKCKGGGLHRGTN